MNTAQQNNTEETRTHLSLPVPKSSEKERGQVKKGKIRNTGQMVIVPSIGQSKHHTQQNLTGRRKK